MAHFCQINENNIVTQVIVVADSDCAGGNFPDSEIAGVYFCNKMLGGTWKQTSYNSNFRKNYAGIGYKYDSALDMFITPQPFESWTLDAQGDWEAPVAYPDDGENYIWNETTTSWDLVVPDVD